MVTDKEDCPSEQMEHFSRNKKATSDNWTHGILQTVHINL